MLMWCTFAHLPHSLNPTHPSLHFQLYSLKVKALALNLKQDHRTYQVSSDEKERGGVEGDDAVVVGRHRDFRNRLPPAVDVVNFGSLQLPRIEAARHDQPGGGGRRGEAGHGSELPRHCEVVRRRPRARIELKS